MNGHNNGFDTHKELSERDKEYLVKKCSDGLTQVELYNDQLKLNTELYNTPKELKDAVEKVKDIIMNSYISNDKSEIIGAILTISDQRFIEDVINELNRTRVDRTLEDRFGNLKVWNASHQ